LRDDKKGECILSMPYDGTRTRTCLAKQRRLSPQYLDNQKVIRAIPPVVAFHGVDSFREPWDKEEIGLCPQGRNKVGCIKI
jgi:hypothetical protein